MIGEIATIRRSSRRGFAAAFLALALAAPALTASALEVSLSPAAATWRDPVVATVSGTVVTSCGPEIVQLRPAGSIPQPSGVIALELFLLPCDVLAPPQARQFDASFELPPLPIGEYELRIVDDATAGGGLTTVSFTIHDVSTVEIVPPEVARSDEPVMILVRSHSACTSVRVERLEGFVIEMVVDIVDCTGVLPASTPREEVVDLGLLPPGIYRVRLIDRFLRRDDEPALATASFRVWDAAGCVPSETALCLHDGRFRVEVEWEEFRGGTGVGRPIPLPGRDDSGLFWFFHEENIELTVKVLEACPLDGHWWVFLASGSTVQYEVTVTDTAAERTVSYRNELGEVPRLVADTAAFATCP